MKGVSHEGDDLLFYPTEHPFFKLVKEKREFSKFNRISIITNVILHSANIFTAVFFAVYFYPLHPFWSAIVLATTFSGCWLASARCFYHRDIKLGIAAIFGVHIFIEAREAWRRGIFTSNTDTFNFIEAACTLFPSAVFYVFISFQSEHFKMINVILYIFSAFVSSVYMAVLLIQTEVRLFHEKRVSFLMARATKWSNATELLSNNPSAVALAPNVPVLPPFASLSESSIDPPGEQLLASNYFKTSMAQEEGIRKITARNHHLLLAVDPVSVATECYPSPCLTHMPPSHEMLRNSEGSEEWHQKIKKLWAPSLEFACYLFDIHVRILAVAFLLFTLRTSILFMCMLSIYIGVICRFALGSASSFSKVLAGVSFSVVGGVGAAVAFPRVFVPTQVVLCMSIVRFLETVVYLLPVLLATTALPHLNNNPGSSSSNDSPWAETYKETHHFLGIPMRVPMGIVEGTQTYVRWIFFLFVVFTFVKWIVFMSKTLLDGALDRISTFILTNTSETNGQLREPLLLDNSNNIDKVEQFNEYQTFD